MENKNSESVSEERLSPMTELVDSVLKPIPLDVALSETRLPWIDTLLESINNAIVEHEIDRECLSMSATGKQLREAIKCLPPLKQVAILNEYITATKKTTHHGGDDENIEVLERRENIQDRRVRREIARASVYAFLFFIFLIIVSIVVISFKKNTFLDTEIIKGFLDTLVHILKFIFGST